MAESQLDADIRQGPMSANAISMRAFEKWIARGQPSDSRVTDWLEAEVEVHQLLELTQQVQVLEHRLADQLSAIRQTQRRLTAEHEVTRILSVSATLVEAAPGILRSICEGLEYGLGVLWSVDHEAGMLRCAEVFESEVLDVDEVADVARERGFAFGEGLPGRVWASQTAMSTTDISEDPSSPRAVGATSMCFQNAIAFPVRNGTVFLGVMEFHSRDLREEDQAIVEMMASIGSQISQFIERRKSEAEMRGELEERRIAGRIQQRLLPRRNPDINGYEISGRCISAVDVGGDCFDFIPMSIDGDESLGILVADASGHGVGSALLVAETRAYLRALAMTCLDVDRMLWLVNQRIAATEEHDGFVTAFLLRLTPVNGAVVYSNAGHWPGIVFNGRGDVRRKLDGAGFPLGFDATVGFSAGIERLEPGELILLYSDGVTEACSPSGELFGVTRLLKTLRSRWGESTDAIREAVLHEVIKFHEGHALKDDITVVIIKRQDTQPYVC